VPVEEGLGIGRDLDEDTTAVVGIGEALDTPVALEGVEHASEGSAGDVRAGSNLTGRKGRPVSLDDSQRVEPHMR